VAAWADRLTPEQEHDARVLATVNAALELRSQSRVLSDADRQAMSPLLASAGYQVRARRQRRAGRESAAVQGVARSRG
jgi:hypothetical protein